MSLTKLVALCALMVGCAGSGSTIAPVAPPVDEQPVVKNDAGKPAPSTDTKLYTGDGWSLSLPTTFDRVDNDDFLLMAFDPNTKIRVVFDNTDWNKSLEDYVAAGLMAMRRRGLFPTATDTTLSGMPAVMLDTRAGKVRILQWATVANGKGWNLGCGGQDMDDNQQNAVCKAVANSVKIGK